MAELDWVDIRERPKAGPVILTDLDAVPEPRNLRRLKAAIRDRWGTVPLLDMLTETALRTGCLDVFAPVGTRGDIAAATLFQRLLLTVYAYGTNTGIRAVAAGEHRRLRLRSSRHARGAWAPGGSQVSRKGGDGPVSPVRDWSLSGGACL